MNTFSVIAGSGHSGSAWLSYVMDSQSGVTWYHHMREEMTGKPWELLDLKAPDDPIFNQYWRWIKGDLGAGNVGDANSWPPHLLPQANEVVPIGQVIYLTRNGVQQLHSLSTTSPALCRDLYPRPMPKAAEVKLRALYDIAPEAPDKDYEDWSRFEKLCLMVAANDFMPDWLRANGLIVGVYAFGDLLSGLDALRELAPGLDDGQLKKMQQTDINRKTKGGRAPSTIWRKWAPEQKAAYRAIVGRPEL